MDARGWPIFAGLVAAWLACAAFGLEIAHWIRPLAAPRTEPFRLMVVQPNLPRGERWASDLQRHNLQRAKGWTQRFLEASKSAPDAIVWPENVLTAPVDVTPELWVALRETPSALGAALILGVARSPAEPTPKRMRSSVLWLSPAGAVEAAVDKTRAIPLLESARPVPGQALLDAAFGRATAWVKVEEAAEPHPLEGDFSLVTVLCYEALFPSIAAAQRSPDSVAILHLADDSWAGGEMATQQLTAYASFRAVEQRLPLIRVAHGGLSVVVDEFGQVSEALPLDEWASTTVEVWARPPVTLAERLAIAALPLTAGFVVWWLTGALLRRRHHGGGPMLRHLAALLTTTLLLTGATTRAHANDTISTFTLDGFSFISFGEKQVAYLPPGSTIQFRFSAAAPDGSIPFTIRPGDVAIDPIALEDGSGSLRYALTRTASGTMRATADGRQIQFDAAVRATLDGQAGQGSYDYLIPFTTEAAVARSLDGSKTLSRSGTRVSDGVWYGQIVGTATNKENAYPEPGAAVYTVLSGRFDSVPE